MWIDAFFLKSMMAYDQPQRENHHKIYGDSVIGSTVRFVATRIDDVKKIGVGSQQVQQSYNSLLPPYVHLGIGKSNNYIESLNTGFSILHENKYQIFLKTPIIPNSQMITFATNASSTKWKTELFTKPDQNLYLIMFGCAFLLFVIGVIVTVLHINEKSADK